MTDFAVDFTYKIEEYGTVELSADDHEQAEDFAREQITELYPDVTDITIDAVKEIKERSVL
jgi:hypothetical protein